MTAERARKRRRLLQECRELGVEVDRLRLENQQLHAELDRREARRFRPRAGLRLLRQVARRARGVVRRLQGGSAADASVHGSPRFGPYVVRPLYPVARERRRVLHVIANFYTGGSARLVVDLIEHLGHRFEQEVLTRDLPPSPAYVGVQLHQQELFGSPRQVRAHLARFRPDFIHLHFLGHHRTAYSRLDWQWYHRIFQVAEQDGRSLIENVNIPVVPYLSDAVSHYVYVSDFVRRRFGPRGAAAPSGALQRHLTIYPGSDLEHFSRPHPAEVPDDCIGMVYRLEGDKLNGAAIEVFIEAVRRRPRTRVLIVGGGTLLQSYRRRVAEAGLTAAFTFTGYVAYEDLPQYLAQMSLFVAPVHSESFGQVSPFAMGMSLPVVGYGVGALPEILGGDALLAPAGDSHALAELIVELLEDRERRLRIGAENRARAERLFSVEVMVERYAALYEAMADAR